jgi:cyclase
VRRVRVIPVLQIQNRKLVKTTKFNSPKYVGDPINTVRIFNDKEIDEIVLIDISATKNKTVPDVEFIEMFASECFMPLCYGGGIQTIDQAKSVFMAGVEKVIIGTAAFTNSKLIVEIAKFYGIQSVVVSVDIRKDFFGRWRVFINSGSVSTKYNPVDYARHVESLGAGELLLQNIEREGSQSGYDLDVIERVSESIRIPVVAVGGASSLEHFRAAINRGASAVGAGDMFIYKGPHKAVLINYPTPQSLNDKLYNSI